MLTSLPELPNCQTLFGIYNKYLYVNKYQSFKYNLKETINYNRYAKIIQRTYRKHLRVKYQKIINEFILRDPTKIISLYLY